MAIVNVDNDTLRELRELDPDFDQFLAGGDVQKDATAADVHTPSAAGSGKKKPVVFDDGLHEAPTFNELMQAADDIDPALRKAAAAVTEPSTSLAEILAAVNDVVKASPPRMLRPHPDGGAHAPFPHDVNAVGKIPPDQMRRFLGALTNPDDLEQRRVPMSSLVAIQPRISPEKVSQMQANGFDKLPTVIRHDGKNLIADGTHRAAAQWMDGDSMLDCKYCALRGIDESLAKGFGFHIIEKTDDGGIEWEFNFEIKKVDTDQQLIFGWASVVQDGPNLVIDHQGDVILPEALEKGAYDFVLEARAHGDSHQTIGTGRLVESMMFTKEKQEALGVIIKNAEGRQLVGWWIGFKVDSADTWQKHKDGLLPEFSIGGHSTAIDLAELLGS